MTQLGIARVVNTKGEPTKEAVPLLPIVKPNKPAVALPGRGVTINIHNHSNPIPAAIAPNRVKPRRNRVKMVAVPKAKSKLAENAAPKKVATPKRVLRQTSATPKQAVKPLLAHGKPTLTKAVRPTPTKPIVRTVKAKRKGKVGVKVAKGVLKVASSPIRLPIMGMSKLFRRRKKR